MHKQRYMKQTEAKRCKHVVILKDGSTADCQRYATTIDPLRCTQHRKLVTKWLEKNNLAGAY